MDFTEYFVSSDCLEDLLQRDNSSSFSFLLEFIEFNRLVISDSYFFMFYHCIYMNRPLKNLFKKETKNRTLEVPSADA